MAHSVWLGLQNLDISESKHDDDDDDDDDD